MDKIAAQWSIYSRGGTHENEQNINSGCGQSKLSLHYNPQYYPMFIKGHRDRFVEVITIAKEQNYKARNRYLSQVAHLQVDPLLSVLNKNSLKLGKSNMLHNDACGLNTKINNGADRCYETVFIVQVNQFLFLQGPGKCIFSKKLCPIRTFTDFILKA